MPSPWDHLNCLTGAGLCIRPILLYTFPLIVLCAFREVEGVLRVILLAVGVKVEFRDFCLHLFRRQGNYKMRRQAFQALEQVFQPLTSDIIAGDDGEEEGNNNGVG